MSGEFDDDFFTIHTVTVETFLGSGAFGDVYADPVDVVGFMDGSRKIVRDATGQQVVSESQFYTNIAKAPLFVTDSKVTYAGASSLVIKVNPNDSGFLDLPDHVEVALT